MFIKKNKIIKLYKIPNQPQISESKAKTHKKTIKNTKTQILNSKMPQHKT